VRAGRGIGVELETINGVCMCVSGGAAVLKQGKTVRGGVETVGEARVGLVEAFVVWFEELGGA
jgi:hypothetical protein